MDEWKPIKSAPKDGTEILAWDGKNIWISAWSENSALARKVEFDWVVLGSSGPEFGTCATITPTHWMNLPKPPSDA